MEFTRVDGRVDINSGITSGTIVFSEEEQRGARSNKFWFNDYRYLYKDVYPLTYEDYAELISSHLARQLGIECAKYDLAIYNGNIGVITENLVKDNENEELLSGTEIITQVYSEYIVPINDAMQDYMILLNEYGAKNIFEFSKLSLQDQIELRNEFINLINTINVKNMDITFKLSDEIDLLEVGNMYDYLDSFLDIYNKDFTEVRNGVIKANNLYDIWNVLEIYSKINNLDVDVEKCMSDLINMFIFDTITSQGDRHADNWGIILNSKDNSFRLCPLYDNSSVFSLNREHAIKNIVDYITYLSNPSLIERKREKIKYLLECVLNHSNSSLKVEYEDVDAKNKNRIMLEKFFEYSSEEFINRILNISNMINDDLLDTIFADIERDTGVPVPEDIKLITKTVLLRNIGIINEINDERRKVR